jgi:hypothetical protein
MKGFFAWVALAASSAHALDNGVGRIPVMGWTSWEPGAREPSVQQCKQCCSAWVACMACMHDQADADRLNLTSCGQNAIALSASAH